MRRLEFTAELVDVLPLYVYMNSIFLARFRLKGGRTLLVGNEGFSCGVENDILSLTWYRPYTINEDNCLVKDYAISVMDENKANELFEGASVEFLLDENTPEIPTFGTITYNFIGKEYKGGLI